MRPVHRLPNLGGAKAIVLHRPHPMVTAIGRQLSAIGMDYCEAWPDLPVDAMTANFIIFDADMGHDEQFPWAPGVAPMPMIALIGSEAPGRIQWVISQNADAHLLKPIGNSGVFSALLIASHAFEARKRQAAEITDLRGRVNARQTIVRAVAVLSARGIDEEQAYAQLRSLAMTWRVSMEDAADQIVGWSRNGGAGEQSHIA
ncbi:ANTAR domain-containing protein [Patescibacteria group bacterium]|nr:ANTAR domain-containing protein [Patescibacteria group bacterium]